MLERVLFTARAEIAILGLLALAGLVLGWNRGQLPRRELQAAGGDGSAATAPDLQLYREIIVEVRGGRGYYEVAREKIPQFGFPIGSPLNWRLPTYAWLLSWLPNKCWIQAVLLLLATGGLFLAYSAKRRQAGVGYGAITAFLLFGVMRWTFDGQAYLAQEVWAAVLILISLAAHARGGAKERGREEERGRQAWRLLAVGAGTGALFFRELTLPYCGVACLVALWNRRWGEASGWATGITAFLAFFAWHIGQVRAQLAGTEVVAATGLSQWLRFGGLDFVLLTTRMNSLLFAAPGWLLWLFLLASLLGLARQADETSWLACLAALAYLLAFAVVGRPENFYWGLMPAPLLAWGTAHGPRAVQEMCRLGCADLGASLPVGGAHATAVD